MRYRPEFDAMQQKVILIDYSPSYELGDFQCKDPDYTVWLTNDAKYYIEENISQVKLLLNRENDDIIGYMALSADSIELSLKEKKISGLALNRLPRAIPALKIGKLAINTKYQKQHYGAYLLFLALAIAQQMNLIGVACRYLSLDADVSVCPTNDQFYLRQGFEYNKQVNKKRQEKLDQDGKGEKLENISMRYDIYKLDE